jgi:hypothetical protein
MDDLQSVVPIVARSLERLIVVGAGGISIWLGYLLFRKAMPSTGELSATAASLSIRLQRIAPGVFFAFFGAAVLAFALANPLSTTTQRSPSPHDRTPGQPGVDRSSFASSMSYADSGRMQLPREQAEKLILAINTIRHYSVLGRFPDEKRGEARVGYDNAITQLADHRSILIDDAFGKGSMDKFLKWTAEKRAGNLAYENSLSEDERKSLASMQQMLEAKYD